MQKTAWQQVQGKYKEKWHKLTVDDLAEIHGKRELLLEKLGERYGWHKHKCENELEQWEAAHPKYAHCLAQERAQQDLHYIREHSYEKTSQKKEKKERRAI